MAHDDLSTPIELRLLEAAKHIKNADALLITAGAGMGVDSGLPDFRGDTGFWKAYPALAKSGLSFTQIANPQQFEDNPARAWGFYGHRLNLYRATVPHTGFEILAKWAENKKGGLFVVTSNVDGQFQKAGIDENHLFEIHGSIHHLQCTRKKCDAGLWSADDIEVKTNDATCTLVSPLPRCPTCDRVSRPNILMFDDWNWEGSRTLAQQSRFQTWMDARGLSAHKVVTVELGAGTNIATIRWQGDHLPYELIRINPRESLLERNKSGVSIDLGALEALERLDKLIEVMEGV